MMAMCDIISVQPPPSSRDDAAGASDAGLPDGDDDHGASRTHAAPQRRNAGKSTSAGMSGPAQRTRPETG
jgi:hypothetical protein